MKKKPMVGLLRVTATVTKRRPKATVIPKTPASSGSDYPLGTFGGGAVSDRGKR